MKKLYRSTILAMALAMMLSCLSGCGNKSEEIKDPEGWETAVENGELEIHQGASGIGGDETWEHDSTVLEHEEYSVISEEVFRGNGIRRIDSSEEKESSENTQEESMPVLEEDSENSVDVQEEAERFIHPLTGEEMQEDVSMIRPYVFAYNNHSAAMPHMGISKSDLIIEYLIESDVTRYTAFFMPWNMEGIIGSIQGTRGVSSEMAIGYDGILIHCGGDAASMQLLREYNADTVDETDANAKNGAMFRDQDRQLYGTEHSLYGNGEKLVEAAESVGMRSEHADGFDCTYGFLFDENAVEQCNDSANNILITFAGGKTSAFSYQEDLKGYTLTQYGKEVTDGNEEEDSEIITFENVINLYAPANLQSDGVHVTIDLAQGGEGVFFTGGKAVLIHWSKNGVDDVFHFSLPDGTPLKLCPGRTYIAINQDGTTNYRGSCSWD